MKGELDVDGTTRLHLGCGSVLAPPPWLNIDLGVQPTAGVHVAAFDLTRTPWPRQGGSVECVYGEHVLEHFDEVDGMRLLAEILRVLEPGGMVRFSMPDLDKVIDIFVRRHASPWWGALDLYGMVDPVAIFNRGILGEAVGGLKFLNGYVSFGDYADGHRFYYTFEHLREKMEYVGFTDVRRATFGQPSDPRMIGESRPERVDLVVEAVRPA